MDSADGKIKKKVKFRPIKTPRYLLGDASPTIREIDLKMYNQHRFKVFSSKPTIDTTPPHMRPLNYVNLAKCYADNTRISEIQRGNKDLVCKINAINKSRGDVDCWNAARFIVPKWNFNLGILENIIESNEVLYKRLKTVKSTYSKEAQLNYWNIVLRKIADHSKYPLLLANKKTIDEVVREQPSISGNMIHYGYKPRVFMDFKLKDGSCIGEIIIELYPDFCPKTVKNFLSFCNPNNATNYRNCRIYNAKNGKFFETGDVTLNNGRGGSSIYGDSFPEEKSVLRHCRQGVVSTVRVREKGSLKTNSKFLITLTAVEELQNRCTVFGKITKGIHVLGKMNYYFKRAGPPHEPIIIKRCGIIPPTKQEMKQHKELQGEDSSKCCLVNPIT